MFERRLKIILAMLALVTLGLGLRAGQIQLVEREKWRGLASDLMLLHTFTEPSRGAIRDRMGRALAIDEPCIDACVDYRAITDTPDPKWLREQAAQGLRVQYGDTFDKLSLRQQKELADQQVQTVRAHIDQMWATLARVSGKSPDELEAIRAQIIHRVEVRKRYVWMQNVEAAVQHLQGGGGEPWYSKWLEVNGNEPDTSNYVDQVSEETESHVIVQAITPEANNELAKKLEIFPGLSLRMSRHRVYPFGSSACHVLGHLGSVTEEQLKEDPFIDDSLRRYWPNDQIGTEGVEGLCEGTLRGERGEVVRQSGSDKIVSSADPVAGKDVRLSIDIELQSDIEEAFAQRRTWVVDKKTGETETRENQHGAAVVIDVASGNVLALASFPNYDLNEFEKNYSKLRLNDVDIPLMDRATQFAVEPGSTAKTMMGLGALTDGTITPQSTTECTGYLIMDGRKISSGYRCWTASEYGKLVTEGIISSVAHHPFPGGAAHPTGFLTATDAIERSCNVFYETLADKMKMDRQRHWFMQFGLGQPTGIGLYETAGRVPNPPHEIPARLRSDTWLAGIGQGVVAATPLQMANAVATIARDGIRIRPRIVTDDLVAPAMHEPGIAAGPDQMDLHLTREALAAVKLGMYRVVNSPAGTGHLWDWKADEPDLVASLQVAGKTGTAQAAKLSIQVRDANGEVVKGKDQWLEPGDRGTGSWYVGGGEDHKELDHAWFIGFAPADHPQIAFCAMVEYGGSGGRVAGGIAHDLLEACVAHGYLTPPQTPSSYDQPEKFAAEEPSN